MKICAHLIACAQHAEQPLPSLLECYCPEILIAHTAVCLRQGLEAIEKYRPDIVFIDVGASDDDCLEQIVAERFDEMAIIVIAGQETDTRRFSHVNVVGFLHKPIVPEELTGLVRRFIRQQQKSPLTRGALERILSAQRGNRRNSPTLSLSVSDGVLFIPVHDIWYIKADGPYSEIHYAGDRQTVIAKPLKELAARLPSHQFDRVHNSYLVNLAFVEKLHRDGYLVLKNQKRIDVSRVNRQRVMKNLMEWSEDKADYYF